MVERYGVFTQRIARISRCIRRLKAEEMARFGLKGPNMSRAGLYLGLDGPLTAAELSERCDEDKAAVSRTLEFLLQNGYVTTEAVSRRGRSPLAPRGPVGARSSPPCRHALPRWRTLPAWA